MRLEAKKFLYDIQQASRLVSQFTNGKSFDEYASDAMMRAAVEREFEIIGEALTQLAKVDPGIAAQISDLRNIISFRNILIHGYALVDDRLVWDIVESKVPILDREVDALLAQHGST